MPSAERRDYGEVMLAQRLRDALARLNPMLPVVGGGPLGSGNRLHPSAR